MVIKTENIVDLISSIEFPRRLERNNITILGGEGALSGIDKSLKEQGFVFEEKFTKSYVRGKVRVFLQHQISSDDVMMFPEIKSGDFRPIQSYVFHLFCNTFYIGHYTI